MPYFPAQSHRTAALYIAGPEVLYLGGTEELAWMVQLAKARGFTVTLPNDTPLALGNEDTRRDADVIFENCALTMNASDAIICDLDLYRGSEPDGGSIYEIGMAYARGIRVYGFTRDKRPMAVKDPSIVLRDGAAFDPEGRHMPYAHLPFAPSVVGSTTIVEGGFPDALAQLQIDLEQESRDEARAAARAASPTATAPATPAATAPGGPRVYIAGPDRFRVDAADYYASIRELCAPWGWQVVTPLDDAPGIARLDTEDPIAAAYNTFDHYQQHVRDCDVIVADLNDYHGWEPNSDTSFECGMGFQLGKRLFGYMAATPPMTERIPNLGADAEYADLAGAKAEPWGYPINLMFASSIPVLEGRLEDVLPRIADRLAAG